MAFPSSFNAQGVLAPGTYQLTLTALRESWLVTGKGLRIREWDSAWRAQLVDNLGVLVNELRSVGLERVFVGGSFVEQRPHPGDVDGYFECPLFYYTGGFLEVGPARICPGPHWDWRTRPVDPKTNEPHTWMWHIYHVELFPDTPGLRLSGIPGKNGQPQTYAEAFRQTRSFQPRGIIQIIP